MITKCKVCNGSGSVSTDVLFSMTKKVCPACNGAGEFDINIPLDRMITCKFCNGRGSIQTDPLFTYERKICPACKGKGLVERPIITSKQAETYEREKPQIPRLAHYKFDVAISYANEDLKIVNNYVNLLSSKGLKVYFDKTDEVGLWGANLYDKFDEIYRARALFCIIFISSDYARKVWTNHERKSAQARALQENREYVLPVRVDDTEIPGIPSTIGYIDIRKTTIEKLVGMTVEKVERLKSRRQSL